jgi:hypothetical protein
MPRDVGIFQTIWIVFAGRQVVCHVSIVTWLRVGQQGFDSCQRL